jgi:hypothetical protein
VKRDLDSKRHRLERAWASYNTGLHNTGNAPRIGREIAQSWRRSSQAVSPAQRTAPVNDPQETLREWYDSLLYAAAAPLLGEIQRTAAEQDFIVGIGDASGKLLWTHTGRHMQRRADALHFVPGGHWDERSVGTNALALALRRGTPTEVFSAEHYLEAVHDWVCYSAPIRDPESGLALGVLDFSTTWQNHNALGLITATALARYVEARLAQLAPGVPLRTVRVGISSAPLQLNLCGSPRVTLNGVPLKLSPRRLELLALLALHPSGLNLDALHAHLYGDRVISFSTLKAELSGLRGLLSGQLASRPYRLTLEVAFDALAVQEHLAGGDVAGALSLYRGPLLPDSSSPTLGEWRDFLAHALRQSAMQRADPDTLWALISSDPEGFGADPELLFRLAHSLNAGDPRLALVQARLRLAGY